MSAETHTINIVTTDGGSTKTVTKDISDLGSKADASKIQLEGLNAVLGVLGAIVGLEKLKNYADTFAKMEGQIRGVTKNAQEYAQVEKQLFDASVRSRTSFEGTVDLYSKLAATTGHLRFSQSDLINTTEAINKLMATAGTSAEGAKAALYQLGQGLGAGALRGEEFNSVLEATNGLFADRLAQSLNLSRAQLKQWADDGKLTTEVIVKGLLKAKGEIDKAFGSSNVTISQAFVVLDSVILRLIGHIDQATGISNLFAKAIIAGALALSEWEPYIAAFGAFVGTIALVYGGIAALTLAFAALNAVMALNPFVLFGAAIAAVIAYIYDLSRSSVEWRMVWIQMRDVAEALWNGIKKWVMDVWETLKGWWSYIEPVFNTFIGLIQKAAEMFGVLNDAVQGNTEEMKKNQAAQEAANQAALKRRATEEIANDNTKTYNQNRIKLNQTTAQGTKDTNANTSATEKNASAMNAASNATKNQAGSQAALSSSYSSSIQSFSEATEFYNGRVQTFWDKQKAAIQQSKDDWVKALKEKTEAAQKEQDEIDKIYEASRMAQQIGVADAATNATTAGEGGSLARFRAGGEGGAFGGYTIASTAAQVGSNMGSGSGVITQLPMGVDSYGNIIYSAGPTPLSQQNKFSDAIQKMGFKGIADIPSASLNNVLKKAYMDSLMGFKDGGQFVVGGSGGSDSKLIQFMASPGERVTVEKPGSSSQRPIQINMTVQTNDADSFRRNGQQVYSDLAAGLSRAVRSA